MIKYKKGYKYQLCEIYSEKLLLKPKWEIKTDYIDFTEKGILTVKKGYAWDGPSGPTVDTKSFMRGSLVHDALYQLMRIKFLPLSWRIEADRLLLKMCMEDGMNRMRALSVYIGVRVFSGFAVKSRYRKLVITAPE